MSRNVSFKREKKISLGKRVQDAILQVDNFGVPIQLLFKKKEQHQTFYGGCFTVLLAFLAAVYLYNMLDQMVSKTDPRTITSEYQTEHPEKVILSPDRFAMAFAMEDAYTFATYQNRSLFKVVLESCKKEVILDQKTGKKDLKFTFREIPLVTCDLTKHVKIPELVPYYERLKLETLYCMDYDAWKTNPPEIEGEWDADIFQWLRLSVHTCKNETGVFEDCAPTEVIDKELAAGYMAMYFRDIVTDLKDPEHPYTVVGKDVFTTFSNKLSKEINIYLRHVYVESDDGFVTEDIKEFHEQSYSKHSELIDTRVKGDFLNVVFRLENKKTVAYRSYIKLQDILGNVGGLWQFLILVGLFVVGPFNKLDLQLKLINQIFSFEIDSNIQHEKEQKLAKKMEEHFAQTEPQNEKIVIYEDSNKVNENSNRSHTQNFDKPRVTQQPRVSQKLYSHFKQMMSMKSINTNRRKTFVRRQEKAINQFFKEYFKQNIAKLQLKLHEYALYVCNCVSKFKAKQNQIEFAIKKLEKQIDIISIQKRLTELEKLKILLLSKEQLQLFDYLPKPLIPVENEEYTIQQRLEEIMQQSEDKQMSMWSVIKGEKTLYQRAMDAYEAYSAILKKKHNNELDLRLVRFLDPKVKRIFDLGFMQNASLQSIDQEKIEQDILSPMDSYENVQINQNQFDELTYGVNVLGSLSNRSKNN